jgi:glycosyltransferase involved in cell wall biosynthesis
MRVLLDYRPALRQRTGVGEYTHQLIKALAALDDPLVVTAFSSSWKDRVDRSGFDQSGVTVIDRRIPVRILNLLWHRAEWPPIERVAGGAFDVVHSFHPLLIPSRTAAQVITIHDLDFLEHPERTRGEIRRDYPSLARAHAHRADHIVVPSRYTAAEVERVLGVPQSHITVCPAGVPAWRAPITRPPAGAGYVLFLGTLEPRKNVGLLLDAYRLLAGRRTIPRLVLAGRASEEARPWLDAIGKPPLSAAVEHIGYVAADARQALFEGARLLVLPSFNEGFGLPVLEALSLGVPTIVSTRGALPELVQDAALIVDPRSPEELAGAIARLLDDDALAAALAGKGLLRARQFTWARSARVLFEAFEHAVAARARRRAAAGSHGEARA